jgi:hypothetical protein
MRFRPPPLSRCSSTPSAAAPGPWRSTQTVSRPSCPVRVASMSHNASSSSPAASYRHLAMPSTSTIRRRSRLP